MSIESSNDLILCCPFSFYLQSFPLSQSFPMSCLFTSGGKVLELQLQHQSFQWIFRLISFRMDWLDLLAVQGTLKSLLWHHNSKASILWCSAFFLVHLSHPYVTTGKTTVKLFSHVRLFVTPWSPPGSSIHGILQVRVLEWVVISFSRESSWPRDLTQVSHIASRRFNLWATREAQWLLTICTFVGKVISLLSNTLSRFVRAFLPRSKCLLISWFQSPSTVILKPKRRKSVTASSEAFYLHVCITSLEKEPKDIPPPPGVFTVHDASWGCQYSETRLMGGLQVILPLF